MASIRTARDEDSAGVIALIGSVFAEYPGVLLDVDREEPELRAPASRFPFFWVAEDQDSEIVGCIGCTECTARAPTVELKKLYVHESARRQGLGRRLITLVEDHARAVGATRIVLWSDTRFVTAHEVYRRTGYEATGRTRELHDLSDTREFEFEKTWAQSAVS